MDIIKKREKSLSYQEKIPKVETKVLVAMKFSEKEYLEELADGRLRFRSLAYYSATENSKKGFYDPAEGSAGIYQANRDISITIERPNQEPVILDSNSGLIKQVRFGYGFSGVCFCTYLIHLGKWLHEEINDENLHQVEANLTVPASISERFGPYVWIIKNGDEFEKRIIEAVKREQLSLQADFVKYIDFDEFHGRLHDDDIGFVKSKKYEDEHEHRTILFGKQLTDPFYLDVGSLRDISVIMSFEEFSKGAHISFG
ncbi:MAG: hypothetical protein EOP04_05895 [Proteobacteria bacterium]|nr:MAG: hypothetical protein EOP04_05895 [Pseudomonadota bacterium]